MRWTKRLQARTKKHGAINEGDQSLYLLAVALAGVGSCGSTSVTKIGTATYAPFAERADVTIFTVS
jgi:hypothetical protein